MANKSDKEQWVILVNNNIDILRLTPVRITPIPKKDWPKRKRNGK